MVPLISLIELCQATIGDNIEQVFVVTPMDSFLFANENLNDPSYLNNVFVVEIIKENGLNCND